MFAFTTLLRTPHVVHPPVSAAVKSLHSKSATPPTKANSTPDRTAKTAHKSFSYLKKVRAHTHEVPEPKKVSRLSPCRWSYLGLLGVFAGAYLVKREFDENNQNILSGRYNHLDDHPPLSTLSTSLPSLTPSESFPFKPTYSEMDLYSLAGYEEVREKLGDLVIYLQNPKIYTARGVAAPKGVILSGPPGVGKTCLAEAVAGHAGVPLFMIGGSELNTKFVGESERLFRELFQVAMKNSPCVVLIDEFDGMAAKRTEELAGRHHNAMVNEILSTLSKNHPGVVIIATTNNYDLLDPAVVRPGRFDTHIHVPLPSLKDRKSIIDLLLKDKKVNSEITHDDLAVLFAGFSGASLTAVVNEAHKISVKNEKEAICLRDFDDARTILRGGIHQSFKVDPILQNITAANEAGTALVGHMLKLGKIYKISIENSPAKLGNTEWFESDCLTAELKQTTLDKICLLVAGRAAELLIDNPVIGSAEKIKSAKLLAKKMIFEEGMGKNFAGSQDEVYEILEEQMLRAQKIIKNNTTIWLNLREALLEKKFLMGDEFLKILDGETLPIPYDTKWFWQSNRDKEKVFSLPVKTMRVVTPSVKQLEPVVGVDNKVVGISITSIQVAKALNIAEDRIRLIRRDSSSLEIVLKPAHNYDDHMEKMVKILKQNDVECYYFTSRGALTIYKEGIDDFVSFVEKKNR